MSEEKIPICPDCGKRQALPNFPCWLCGKQLGPEHLVSKEHAEQVIRRAEIGKEPAATSETTMLAAQAALLALWVMVMTGVLFASGPPALFFIAASVPAVVILLQADVSTGGRISLGIVHVLWIGFLVVLGLIVALYVTCIAAFQFF